jgi:hypothetical protein
MEIKMGIYRPQTARPTNNPKALVFDLDEVLIHLDSKWPAYTGGKRS